jgi:heme-degrading monooxygenase HmoA
MTLAAEVLETAVLNVIPGQEAAFEAAFTEAQSIFASMDGYIAHQLQRCVEHPCQYLLLVRWKTLEAHTVGFRDSDEYQDWKRLLHHFYDPFPTVEHYQLVLANKSG